MKHTTNVYELNNGSKLLLINSPGTEACIFGVSVRAGSYLAPKGKEELAHLLEHMMFCGSKDYPSKEEFAYEVEKNGSENNAVTHGNAIDFIYRTGKNYIEKTIELSISQLKSPLLTEESFLSEKNVIKRELEPLLDSIYGDCSRKLNHFLFPEKPELKARIVSLENINYKDACSHYSKYFYSGNTKFVLAGSFSDSEISGLIKKLEAELVGYPERSGEEPLVYLRLNQPSRDILVTNSKRAERNCFMIQFAIPVNKIDISPETKVLMALLNKGGYSRIFKRIRKEGISYGIKTGYILGEECSGIWVMDTSDLEHSLQIFDVASDELNNIRKGDFSEKEIERAKGFIHGSLERSWRSAFDLVDWYIDFFLDDNPWKDLNDYMESIKTVDKESVVRAANELIKKDNWVLSILGPDAERDKKEYEKIIKKYF